jgi:mono/diheme cytochrome c family protein
MALHRPRVSPLARLRSRTKATALLAGGFGTAVIVTACGIQGVQVPTTSPLYHGAVLFRDHCSGCHTISIVGAEGSATSTQGRLRTNGPNFNQRKEDFDQVIFAIENGGFSGAIMPANVVVGQEAVDIAKFLAHYSGAKAEPAVSAVGPNGSSAVPNP